MVGLLHQSRPSTNNQMESLIKYSVSIYTCIWLIITNLVGIYPFIILLKYNYLIGAIITFLAMVFSILWHINEHQSGCKIFVLSDIFFGSALFVYCVYLFLNVNNILAIKLIFPTIAIVCLIMSKIVQMTNYGYRLVGDNIEPVYAFFHTIWHVLAFLTVVVMMPENKAFYPYLI